MLKYRGLPHSDPDFFAAHATVAVALVANNLRAKSDFLQVVEKSSQQFRDYLLPDAQCPGVKLKQLDAQHPDVMMMLPDAYPDALRSAYRNADFPDALVIDRLQPVCAPVHYHRNHPLQEQIVIVLAVFAIPPLLQLKHSLRQVFFRYPELWQQAQHQDGNSS